MNNTPKNNWEDNSERYLELLRQRIVELQNKHNISSRKLSTTLGVSDNYIQRTLSGNMTPSLDKIFDICDFFYMTPKEFFDFETPIDSGDILLAECTRQMTSEQKEMLARMLKYYFELKKAENS